MSDENDANFQQYPAWREAVKSFDQEGFKHGDTLTFDWLYTAFMIERPELDDRRSVRELNKIELDFLTQFDGFQSHLLQDRQIALENIRGVGYRVVPPSEQTDWAERNGVAEVKRAIRKMGERLTNVDLAALTGEQRKHNADALARFSMMRGMISASRRSVMKIGE